MGTGSRRACGVVPAYGVVIPVRAFRSANTRLAASLDDATRAALAERLAARAVDAAATAPVVVVTSAPEVRSWARSISVDTIEDPGSLDAAARAGAVALLDRGCVRIVVAHADLPLVVDYSAVLGDGDRPVAALVPCHRGDGTPVLSIPAAAASTFGFAYGPGSYDRHVAAAGAAGLTVRTVRERRLAFDIDTLDDLAQLERDDPTLLGTRPASEASTR